MLAGLRAADGELLLTMDGDGQNDPRDFPVLLDLVESGALDLACGWRVDRHDSWLRRALSRFANAIRQGIFDDGVHDSGCQLRVMRREVRGRSPSAYAAASATHASGEPSSSSKTDAVAERPSRGATSAARNRTRASAS